MCHWVVGVFCSTSDLNMNSKQPSKSSDSRKSVDGKTSSHNFHEENSMKSDSSKKHHSKSNSKTCSDKTNSKTCSNTKTFADKTCSNSKTSADKTNSKCIQAKSKSSESKAKSPIETPGCLLKEGYELQQVLGKMEDCLVACFHIVCIHR